jgi:transketolase
MSNPTTTKGSRAGEEEGLSDDLEAIALEARREIVKAVARAKGGHLGGPLSAVEILVALYFSVLRVRPELPQWPERDRFVLSKGHSSIALYTVLSLRGYFPREELLTFDAGGTRLQGHPDMTVLPGIDMSTGSLGLGFSAAVGMALGAKHSSLTFTTFVLLGDGECNEGIVWEGAHIASHYALDNLVAIVDHNRLQQFGWLDCASGHRLSPYQPGDLAERWAAFGWHVLEVDGHDVVAVIHVLERARDWSGSPCVVVAHTTKGKGISFMEGNYAWHSRVPTDQELQLALDELDHEPTVATHRR